MSVEDLVLAFEQKFGVFDIAKFPLVLNYSAELVKPKSMSLDEKKTLVSTAIKQYVDKTNMSEMRKKLFLLPLDTLVKTKLDLA